MNFSDMLRNKKKKREDVMNENNEVNPDMGQEFEQPDNQANNQNESADSKTAGSDTQNEISVEDKLKEEIAEANNKYLRLYAEFDNYKRRTNKERLELLQTAEKDLIVNLLPVVDDFERAIKSIETATDIAAVKEGVVLIQSKLKGILTQQGLKEMESVGNLFDADTQEAITNVPAPSNDLKGKVLDEIEKGYYLNDKVIRFAKVIVGA